LTRTKTQEQFSKEVLDLGKGDYQLLSGYKNTRSKVLIKHMDCGTEYEVRPSNFLSGRRCPLCSKSPQFTRKDTQIFKKEVKELTEGLFEVVGEYVNAHMKIGIKHLICNKVHEVNPTSFLNRGGYCVFCNGTQAKANQSKKRKKTESFGMEVRNAPNGEYRLLSTYKNNHTKVKILHASCGKEYAVAPNNFSRGSRCPQCSKVRRKTHDEFLEQVKSLNEPDYQIVSEYINSGTPIKFKHSICNSEFMLSPGKFLSGRRCTKCSLNESKGEILVENVLKDLSLNYQKQLKFKSCKNINSLPFDFGILNEVGTPVFLIEYDGIQHYEEKEFFGGRESFVQRVRNDRIKSNYAKEKEIPLLRIRYDEKNPEKLLEQVLKRYLFTNQKEAMVS